MLFLLFPLISATDDLYAMRQVLKESSPGKRTLTRAVNHSFAAGGSNTPPAELNSILQGLPCNKTCGCIVSAHPRVISPGRAPPFLLLAIASQTATLVCGAPSLSSHVTSSERGPIRRNVGSSDAERCDPIILEGGGKPRQS